MKHLWAELKAQLGGLARRTGFACLSRKKRWACYLAATVVVLLGLALAATWDDIMKTGLDPGVPFQLSAKPPAPDYSKPSAWAINPLLTGQKLATGPVDVFFIHPTTFNGGHQWNGPIDDKPAERQLERIMLPNYAGPFARVGRMFAPRYRQASVYAYEISLREDSRDARTFAYGDVLNAFRTYVSRYNLGRPFIVVGVEQGAVIGDRLLREEIGGNPQLLKKLAAAYLIDAFIPAMGYGPNSPIPACAKRAQARCVVGWASTDSADPSGAVRLLNRAKVWTPDWLLDDLGDQPTLCVNPLIGGVSDEDASAKLNLGAVNASELEWGARAAFLPRQVSAQCEGGMLRISRPRSASLRPASGFPDKFKEPPYNPFFADLEADAMKRVAVYYGRTSMPPGAPPIEQSLSVDGAPVHKVDDDK